MVIITALMWSHGNQRTWNLPQMEPVIQPRDSFVFNADVSSTRYHQLTDNPQITHIISIAVDTSTLLEQLSRLCMILYP